MDRPLTFGAFIAPFHPVGQNPTLAIERDLELVVRLDQLGFNEAWIGEHHSAGYEIIASPEVAIAVLSQRTKNIKLGTGVSSLPYHQPLILADRMVLLDHITRGRVMFGVGPGALPSDARPSPSASFPHPRPQTHPAATPDHPPFRPPFQGPRPARSCPDSRSPPHIRCRRLRLVTGPAWFEV